MSLSCPRSLFGYRTARKPRLCEHGGERATYLLRRFLSCGWPREGPKERAKGHDHEKRASSSKPGARGTVRERTSVEGPLSGAELLRRGSAADCFATNDEERTSMGAKAATEELDIARLTRSVGFMIANAEGPSSERQMTPSGGCLEVPKPSWSAGRIAIGFQCMRVMRARTEKRTVNELSDVSLTLAGPARLRNSTGSTTSGIRLSSRHSRFDLAPR